MLSSPINSRSFSSPVLIRKASSHTVGGARTYDSFGGGDEQSSCSVESASSRSSKYGRINVVREAKNDLAELKKCMRRDNSRVLTRVASGPADFIDNAKLGTIEQVRDDLRHDELEGWFKKHKKKNPSNLSMEEKRCLRKWFLKMDTDGSGEVGADELQDPLLSAGVVKTRADIEAMLKSVEMNEDKEVTFDNFLRAVSNSKSCKKDKMKSLQVMSSDQYFSMDTLLSQERRKILLKGIVDDAKVRQSKLEAVLDSTDGQKLSKKQREAIVREQEDKLSDHNDFVNSLESVLSDKFRLLKHRREALTGGGRRGRQRDKVSASFSFSDHGSMDLSHHTTTRMADLQR